MSTFSHRLGQQVGFNKYAGPVRTALVDLVRRGLSGAGGAVAKDISRIKSFGHSDKQTGKLLGKELLYHGVLKPTYHVARHAGPTALRAAKATGRAARSAIVEPPKAVATGWNKLPEATRSRLAPHILAGGAAAGGLGAMSAYNYSTDQERKLHEYRRAIEHRAKLRERF